MNRYYFDWQEDGYYGVQASTENNRRPQNNSRNTVAKAVKRTSVLGYAFFALAATMLIALVVEGTKCFIA